MQIDVHVAQPHPVAQLFPPSSFVDVKEEGKELVSLMY